MAELAPRPAKRLLRWSDAILDLQDVLANWHDPIYLVGGVVRDALMTRAIKDVDIATSGSGVKLARQIANRMRGDFYALDPERDVGRAIVETREGKLTIDVAKFRGADLEADLLDRDFTLNAMAVDLRADLNALYDPLDGEQDVYNRVIRRTHANALAHDPARMLRAVRQSVQLNFRIEAATLHDIRAQADAIRTISAERARDEFMKMLALPKAVSALRVAETVGLLAVLMPEAGTLRETPAPSGEGDAWTYTLAVIEALAAIVSTLSPTRTEDATAQFATGMVAVGLSRFRKPLEAHLAHRWADERPHVALLMLAGLLHPIDPELVDMQASALRLSNDERERLVLAVRYAPIARALTEPTPLDMHRFWRNAGEAGVDACLLALAAHWGTEKMRLHQDAWVTRIEGVQTLFEAYYERRDVIVNPPRLLSTKDIMEQLNLRPGPVIGAILTRIREGQVTGEIQTAEDALQLAREYLDANGDA